tara:strand:+ start:240 stop:713 length:474 start_codon:yes stop_codon:yes gene_type:complete
MTLTRTQLKSKYHSARYCAIERNIEWHFTYDEWIAWWGDDMSKRGNKFGQLVMARTGDIGPYHPDNVRKATCSENIREGNLGKVHSDATRIKIGIANKGRKVIYKTGISHSCQPIQTPLGRFESRKAAGIAHNINPSTINLRMKKFPTEYYYIKENA